MIRSREQELGVGTVGSSFFNNGAKLKLCTRSSIYLVTVLIDSMCSRTEYKGRAARPKLCRSTWYLSGTKKAMREVHTNSVPGPLP